MKLTFATIVAACAFVVGCGGRIATDETPGIVADPTPQSSVVEEAPNPFRAGDDWIGTYTCPQGLTDLDLHVVSVDDDEVTATFDFRWNDTHGSFELSGRWQPVGARMRFVAGAWIDRPSAKWWTVDMDGTIDATSTVYTGAITHEGCGAFSLTHKM